MPKTYTYTTMAGLRQALRSVGKEAKKTLRDASSVIASDVAVEAASRATSLGGAAKLVAPTIRAKRGDVPSVQMGGARKLRPGARQTVGDILWGAEFGGGSKPRTRQFERWRGSGPGSGYFLFPTVRDDEDQIMERYGDALMKAVDKAAR